eukprot:gene22692-biopygen7224
MRMDSCWVVDGERRPCRAGCSARACLRSCTTSFACRARPSPCHGRGHFVALRRWPYAVRAGQGHRKALHLVSPHPQ